MDEIQKVLVKAGRKDLAQKYYQKVARSVIEATAETDEYRTHRLLSKIVPMLSDVGEDTWIDIISGLVSKGIANFGDSFLQDTIKTISKVH